MSSSGLHQHFIFLAAVTYDGVLSGRTRQLAESLAASGHEVTFVETPSTKLAMKRGFLLGAPRRSPEGVRIVRVHPLPWALRTRMPWLVGVWTRVVERRLQRLLPNLDSAVLIVSSPWWAPLAQSLPAWLCCYDYIDHVAVQAGRGREAAFAELDNQMLRVTHLVTTVSEPLRRDVARRVDEIDVHLIPNGVRADWIEKPPAAMRREKLTPHPDRRIVGFVGSIFEWIDVDLIAAAAQQMPDHEFVLVGPQREGVSVEALRRQPNVRILPPVPATVVPSVLQAFDVCLIPFTQDAVSTSADPLKLYEYLALGRPVVSTVAFSTTSGAPPMLVARNTDELCKAIREAVDTDTPDARRRRREFAAQHTWTRRASDFVAAVDRIAARVRGG